MKKVKSVLAICLSFYLFGLTTMAAAATFWTLEPTANTGQAQVSRVYPGNAACRKGDPSSETIEAELVGVVLGEQLDGENHSTAAMFPLKIEHQLGGSQGRGVEYDFNANSDAVIIWDSEVSNLKVSDRLIYDYQIAADPFKCASQPSLTYGIQQSTARAISTAGPTAKPIPEPASLILLGMGLIVLSLSLKKKARRHQ